MPFTWTDIAALIGAAAWLQPVIAWIYHRLRRAQLKLLLHEEMRLGFSNIGPGIILDLAFFSQRGDVLVTEMNITAKHEDKDEHVFRWIWQEEQQGVIDVPQAGSMIFRKTRKSIAIFLENDTVQDKTIQFSDSRYIPEYERTRTELLKAKNELSKAGKPHTELQTASQLMAMNDLFKRFFYWKEGLYTLDVTATFNGKHVASHTAKLRITKPDLENLRANLDLIEYWIEEEFVQGNPSIPIQWTTIPGTPEG